MFLVAAVCSSRVTELCSMFETERVGAICARGRPQNGPREAGGRQSPSKHQARLMVNLTYAGDEVEGFSCVSAARCELSPAARTANSLPSVLAAGEALGRAAA